MSDDLKTGENLDEFLINLAEGLSLAQNRLNKSPVSNAMGQQTMIYHIPKMEFELQLEMTATTSSKSDGRAFLKFSPHTKRTSDVTESASSIIKGVMVATPAGAGLPMPSIELSAIKETPRKIKLVVQGNSSDGNVLNGALVQINIDKELSDKLNKQEGRNQALKPATQLQLSTVTLSDTGSAETYLMISPQETKNQLIVISADFLSANETLLYRFE